MRFQIAVRRLLDVLHALEGLRRTLFDPGDEVEQILHVGALLVEVERVMPFLAAARCLSRGRGRLDPYDTLDVPGEIVAVELDLEMRQAVVRDPLGQRLRIASVNRSVTSPSVSGSSAPTRWYSGMRAFGSRSV